MIVWVQLPALPVHFYHKEVLFSLGNMIGRTIKLDYHTLHQQRARFARMAVEIDLSKPLVTRVRLDGAWQYLEYENLPMCCFECGKIGHTKETCPNLKPPSPQLSIVVAGGSPAPETVTTPEEKPGFGPWMIVTRKSRRGGSNTRKGNPDSSNNEDANQGKNGKGKFTGKESLSTTEQSHGGKRAGFQRTDGGNRGEKLGIDRGFSTETKGKEAIEVSTGKDKLKGILGPVPQRQQADSPRPKNVPIKLDGPSSSGAKPTQSSSPRKKLFAGMDQAPKPPSLTTITSSSGTTIQLVIPTQPETNPDQQNEDPLPSASARTKSQKKLRKKQKSPGKAARPISTKALQIWTPVKERKSKARSKLATLTLQEIEAWTGAANRAGEVVRGETTAGDNDTTAKEKASQPSTN
ncbi:unnamed protein product [Linum tenue]|uniref:CCHC-type domain-containing protein n=1 Tax=Linum tenue TaxID=586396 RepID=A0AAV0R2R0_9ROSI|nr:unnamed protein product [Linum tenue]